MVKQERVWIWCALVLCSLGIGFAEASAQLGQRPADEYVARMDRPERVANLHVDEVIERLRLGPGDIVADIGSGSGAFSVPMARAIGPTGVLYAVDIDQEMLDFVANRAQGDGVRNVRTVLGEYDDPKLPVNDVDVVFLSPDAAHDRASASVSERGHKVSQARWACCDHRSRAGRCEELDVAEAVGCRYLDGGH